MVTAQQEEAERFFLLCRSSVQCFKHRGVAALKLSVGMASLHADDAPLLSYHACCLKSACSNSRSLCSLSKTALVQHRFVL